MDDRVKMEVEQRAHERTEADIAEDRSTRASALEACTQRLLLRIQRRVDIAAAGLAADRGDVSEARRLLSKYNLNYMVIEVLPGGYDTEKGNPK